MLNTVIYDVTGREERGEMRTSSKLMGEKYRDQVLVSHEILGEIFKYLDFPRLKNLRLTCKLWNRETSRLFSLRSVHVLLWGQDSSCSKFRSTMMATHDPSVPHPFRDVHMNLANMTIEESTWLSTNLRVTELVVVKYPSGPLGPEMRKHGMNVMRECSLTLRKLQSPYLGDWDEELDSELRFPLLEELEPLRTRGDSIVIAPLHSAPSAQQEVDFFSRIISLSPKLRSLKLKSYPHCNPLLANASSLVRINELDLSPCVLSDDDETLTWGLLERMNESGSLRELSWRGYRGMAPETAHAVLSHLAVSLQRLHITWNLHGLELHPYSFPVCPLLTHLEVIRLYVDSVNWTNLPNLRYLKFQRVSNNYRLEGEDFVPCTSVKKISYHGIVMYYKKRDPRYVTAPEMEAFFPKLFRRFPNATDWKVHHTDVMPFCKAAVACGLAVRKFSVYLPGRKVNGDVGMTFFMDRYAFSLLPSLLELEELVLHNVTSSGMEMKLAEVDFPKLSKLKLLKVYNYYDPPESECAALRSIPKVLMVSNSRSIWSGPILSLPNVDFRLVSYKYF